MASIIGAAISATVAIIAAIMGYVQTNKTNEANVAATEKTNATSMEIAEKNNATQLESIQMQQQYNSPIEQLKRFQEAGINPSVAFAGNLSNVVNASSGVTPSMPSLIPALKQMPFNIAGGLSESFVNTAQALQAVAEARHKTAETKETESLLSERLKSLSLQNESQDLANNLQQMFGSQKMKAEIALLTKEALVAASQSDLNTANEKFLQIEKIFKQSAIHLNESQRSLYDKQASSFETELRAKVNALNASAEESRASAAKSRSEAETEDLLRDWRQKVLTGDAEFKREQAEYFKAMAYSVGRDNLLKDFSPKEIMELRNMTVEQMEEQLKTAKFENTVLGRFAKYLSGAASNIGGAFILAAPKF